jgi:hypothetical protein
LAAWPTNGWARTEARLEGNHKGRSNAALPRRAQRAVNRHAQ